MFGAASRISVAAIGAFDQRAGARVVADFLRRPDGSRGRERLGDCNACADIGPLRLDIRSEASLNAAAYRSIYTYIKRPEPLLESRWDPRRPIRRRAIAWRCARPRAMSRNSMINSWRRAGCARPSIRFLQGWQRRGAMTINALAAELVMDRTTLGRNILPVATRRLIAVGRGDSRPAQQGVAADQQPAWRGFAPGAKPGERRRRGSKPASASSAPKSCARCCSKPRQTHRTATAIAVRPSAPSRNKMLERQSI